MQQVIQDTVTQIGEEIKRHQPEIQAAASATRLPVQHYLDSLTAELDRLNTAVGTTVNPPAHQKVTPAPLLFHLQAAHASVSLLDQALQAALSSGAPAAQVGPLKTFVSQTLLPWFKPLGAAIWSLVQQVVQLATPVSWTLKGNLGSGVLGVSDVGIEVQFGP